MPKKLLKKLMPAFLTICIIIFFLVQYQKKSFDKLLGTDAVNITKASMRNGNNGDYVETNNKNKIKELINLLDNRYYNKAFYQSPRSGYSYYYDFYSGDKKLIRIIGSGSTININGDYYDVSKAISAASLSEWFNSMSSINTASVADQASSYLTSKDVSGDGKVYKNKEYNISLKYNKIY